MPRLIVVELIEQDDRSAVERRAESSQERDQRLRPSRFLYGQDLAVFRGKGFPHAVTERLSRPLLPVLAPDVEINGEEEARFRFGPGRDQSRLQERRLARARLAHEENQPEVFAEFRQPLDIALAADEMIGPVGPQPEGLGAAQTRTFGEFFEKSFDLAALSQKTHR